MESLFIQILDDVLIYKNDPYDWFCGPRSHLKVSDNLHTVTCDNKCEIIHIPLSICIFGVNNTKISCPLIANQIWRLRLNKNWFISNFAVYTTQLKYTSALVLFINTSAAAGIS